VASCASLTTVDQLKTQLAKTSKVSTLLEPYLPRILAATAKAYTDSVVPLRPIGHPQRRTVIPKDSNFDSPVAQQLNQEREVARLAYDSQEDQLEKHGERDHGYTWAPKVAIGLIPEVSNINDTVPAATTAENPYAALPPASIPPLPYGIPADIYHLRSIPPELRNSMPPLGCGRPSITTRACQHAIIRSYSVARGYTGK